MIKLDAVQIVFLAIMAALIILLGVLLMQNSKHKKTIDNQKLEIGLYKSAQDTNMDTIGRQKAALLEWKEACSADEAAIDASVRALEADKARLEQELARARDDREVIYVKDPAAREWSDTGMPSGIADRLFPHPHRPH